MQNISFSFSSLLIGLLIGLLFSIVVWIQARMKNKSKIKSYVEENERLKNHLNTQMHISAKGNEAVQKELNEHRKMIDNLRSTVSVLREKPGRDKLHVLYVYDKAIHIMFEKHPGFATMWAGALKEAEYEIEKAESGLLPMVKKVFKPAPQLIAIKSIRTEDE
jgi:MFS superfamily sulfate permease-like transporter